MPSRASLTVSLSLALTARLQYCRSGARPPDPQHCRGGRRAGAGAGRARRHRGRRALAQRRRHPRRTGGRAAGGRDGRRPRRRPTGRRCSTGRLLPTARSRSWPTRWSSGQTYTYGFWSFDASGNASAEASHSAKATAPPLLVAPVNASDGGPTTRVALSWGNPANPAGTPYTVKYATRDPAHRAALRLGDLAARHDRHPRGVRRRGEPVRAGGGRDVPVRGALAGPVRQ